MKFVHAFWIRTRMLFRRRRLERDLADEFAFHLEMAAQAGDPDPLRTFGNPTRIQEEARERWRFTALESLAADVKYAVRGLARSPSFSLAAILVLALGIGGNTVIFSVLSALLLSPLPGVHAPQQLIGIARSQDGSGFDTLSFANFRDVERRSRTLSGVAAYHNEKLQFETAMSAAQPITAQVVTAQFFPILRPFLELGTDVASPGNVVLSRALWRTAFAADPHVIGRKVLLAGKPLVVTGVAAAGFCGVDCSARADAWISLDGRPPNPDLISNRGLNWLQIVARLRPDTTVGEAAAELRSLGAQLATEYPGANRGLGLAVNSRLGMDPKSRSELTAYLNLLAGVTLLVLVAACSNVGNLLLARAASRRREIATRLAVGASRARVVRQLLTESVVLAAAAGLAGLALAGVLTSWLASQPGIPAALTAFGFRPDARMLGFSLFLSVVTGVVFGLAPALQAAGVELAGTMKDLPQTGLNRLRGRDLLMATQMAVSLALLIASGLLIRSLENAHSIRLGFDTRGIWLAECSLSAPDAAFTERALDVIRSLPGVTVASAVAVLPLQGRAMDGPVDLGDRTVPARFNTVADGHFAALGIRVREGREFTPRDSRSAPELLVNESFAHAYGAHLGQIVRVFPDNTPREIVGVVADHVYSHLREGIRPAVFRSFRQDPRAQFSFEVRGPVGTAFPASLAESLRRVDTKGAIGRIVAMDDLYRAEMWQSRLTAGFVAAFAVLALLLASVGLYGIVAYSVIQRRREIGVRLALGAGPGDILILFIHRIAILTVAGLAAGNALAFGLTGLLRGQLYGIAATDPKTILLACALLSVVAAIAALVPAARAAGADASEVLREQ